MRVIGTCWSTVALAACHVHRVWAAMNNKQGSGKSGKLNYERQRPIRGPRPDGQRVIENGCPASHQLCPESVGGGCCPMSRVCGMNGCYATSTTTIVSPLTVNHPKITEGPKVKRKLGSNRWDLIHDGIQGQKRDAASCPTDYQSCPQSLNGGCCPTDRVCGTSSCYPTSSAPASACGISGYVACGIPEGGGCCPSNYSCATDGCSPSPGVAYSETCGVDSYLCPSSLNYGCCKNGMACGINNCYATSITTFTFTETFTTTDASSYPHTVTSTVVTAATPSAPTAAATSSSAPSGVVPKIALSATAIPKTEASSAASGGLTRPEIGGIIGGAVAILIVIIVATFFIIRKLNKAIEVTTAKSRTSSSGPRSRPSRPRPSLGPDVDAMSFDPLMMTGSDVSRSIRHPSHPSAAHPAHEVEANSPPTFVSPFSPRSPPYSHYLRGYNPVPTSESQYSNSSGGYKNPSLESSPPITQSPAGYFDIPPKPDLRDQNLRFGHNSPPARRPSHGRNWSDASDQSQVSAGSSSLAELDAGPDGDRRSSLQRALQGLGMGRMVSRRRSDPVVLTGGPKSRSPEWTPSPGAGGLDYIQEVSEVQTQGANSGLSNNQFQGLPLLSQQNDGKRRQQEYDQKVMGHRIEDRGHRP